MPTYQEILSAISEKRRPPVFVLPRPLEELFPVDLTDVEPDRREALLREFAELVTAASEFRSPK